MGRRSGHHTRWLITYSDFMTLLLTFFVVFYASTEGINDAELSAIIIPFKGGEGVLNETSVIPAKDLAKRFKRAEEWERLSRYIDEQGLGDEVVLDLLETGNRIILRESLTFQSGQAQLLKQSEEVLKEISYLFDDNVSSVEVQGHTDNIPIRRSDRLSNWGLGAERAISVLRFLVENTNLPPEKFKATSLGEFHPIASNDTPQGRRENRRVEILIRYSDGKPRAFRTQTQ